MICKKIINLEEHFFYRLIKVLYYFLLIILFFISFFLGYQSIPTKIGEKDYLACIGGVYPFSDINISTLTFNKRLNNKDDEIAKNTCYKNDKENEIKYPGDRLVSDPKILAVLEELKNFEVVSPKGKNYHIILSYEEKVGSWIDVLSFWFLGPAIVYVILNLIGEILIYVVFGIKFSFNWLKAPCRHVKIMLKHIYTFIYKNKVNNSVNKSIL